MIKLAITDQTKKENSTNDNLTSTNIFSPEAWESFSLRNNSASWIFFKKLKKGTRIYFPAKIIENNRHTLFPKKSAEF